ncbi:MAG: DUF2202 domain-containing protein [Methanoregula sp.]|jgi:hypothetical protein
MERKFWFLIGGIILGGIIIAAIAISGTGGTIPGRGTGAGGQGYGYGNGQGFGTGVYAVIPAGNTGTPLSINETNDILSMREEEQMAHDLYTRWGANYSLPVFANIARSETTHISRVQALIDRYGLGSYRIGNASAGYTDARIQKLYDTLGPVGDASLQNALESGLIVEDQDIEDLDRAIADTTRTDLLSVWQELRAGSLNHRQAFLRSLGR